MRSYQFIIVRDDGEQRKVKAVWDKNAALGLQKAHGLSLEEEVKKFMGHEIMEEIRRWEDEDERRNKSN